MRCVSPINLKVKAGRVNVPCGRCHACLSNKRNEWTFRLLQELKSSSSCYFLTFTYSNENLTFIDDFPQLVKRDVQLFLKRLRQEQKKVSDDSIRYYIVGEYGTRTKRPHYHAIMFNLFPALLDKITEIWALGSVHQGIGQIASIHYTTKYVIQKPKEKEDDRVIQKPFALISNKPGIGAGYMRTHGQWHKDNEDPTTKVNGVIGRLPRYYREKLFSKSQKEKFASEIRDKMTKTDVKKDNELFKKGVNPFKHNNEEYQQFVEIINKSLKNGVF